MNFFAPLKKKFAARKVHLYRLGESAERDWLVLLSGFALVTIIFVGVTYQLYEGLLSQSLSLTASSTAPLVNMKDLDRVLLYYNSRQEDFDRILKEPVTVGDPSK